jgi:hypothetical protein
MVSTYHKQYSHAICLFRSPFRGGESHSLLDTLYTTTKGKEAVATSEIEHALRLWHFAPVHDPWRDLFDASLSPEETKEMAELLGVS